MPIPVIAGICWVEHGANKADQAWAAPVDVEALAVAWSRNPDCVRIRWRPAPHLHEREDWIEARYVRRALPHW